MLIVSEYLSKNYPHGILNSDLSTRALIYRGLNDILDDYKNWYLCSSYAICDNECKIDIVNPCDPTETKTFYTIYQFIIDNAPAYYTKELSGFQHVPTRREKLLKRNKKRKHQQQLKYRSIAKQSPVAI